MKKLLLSVALVSLVAVSAASAFPMQNFASLEKAIQSLSKDNTSIPWLGMSSNGHLIGEIDVTKQGLKLTLGSAVRVIPWEAIHEAEEASKALDDEDDPSPKS